MQFTPVRTAWLCLVGALAAHVIDEATTGFLDVYNPTVRVLREQLGWFPMPEFTFDVWASGLAAAIVILTALTPWVDRGVVRVLAIVFAAMMVGNGVAHLAGTAFGRTVESVRFERPMPGTYSAPLLIGAGWLFIVRARRPEGARESA